MVQLHLGAPPPLQPLMTNPLENIGDSSTLIPVKAWKTPENTGKHLQVVTASQTASSKKTKYDRYWFTYKGREYRMQKRGTGRKSRWYLYFEHNKKRIPHSCGSGEKLAAEENAKLFLEAFWSGHQEALRTMMRGGSTANYSSIGRILQWADTAGLDLVHQSLRGYLSSLRVFVRKVTGRDDFAAISASVLSPQNVRKYFADAAEAANAQPKQEDENRIKRTANSTLNQATALFTRRNLEDMRADGVILPDLKPFLEACQSRRFDRIDSRHVEIPSDAIIRRTLIAWKNLTDRNMFLAIGHALSFGLRKNEMAQARWTWHTCQFGQQMLDSAANVKSGAGRIQKMALNPFYRVMLHRARQEKWIPKNPDVHILEGHETYRTDILFRETSDWMRALGWKTQKTFHAFRDYVGSLITMKYGIRFTKEWLDHSTVQVTEDHYSSFVNRAQLIKPERIYISWSREISAKSKPSQPSPPPPVDTTASPPSPTGSP